jgi:hypothetical protein
LNCPLTSSSERLALTYSEAFLDARIERLPVLFILGPVIRIRERELVERAGRIEVGAGP